MVIGHTGIIIYDLIPLSLVLGCCFICWCYMYVSEKLVACVDSYCHAVTEISIYHILNVSLDCFQMIHRGQTW